MEFLAGAIELPEGEGVGAKGVAWAAGAAMPVVLSMDGFGVTAET
jgi:hypothetical protein